MRTNIFQKKAWFIFIKRFYCDWTGFEHMYLALLNNLAVFSGESSTLEFHTFAKIDERLCGKSLYGDDLGGIFYAND